MFGTQNADFFFGTCVVTGDVVDIDAVEQKS